MPEAEISKEYNCPATNGIFSPVQSYVTLSALGVCNKGRVMVPISVAVDGQVLLAYMYIFNVVDPVTDPIVRWLTVMALRTPLTDAVNVCPIRFRIKGAGSLTVFSAAKTGEIFSRYPQNFCVVVLNTIKPGSGLAMALICAVVRRGSRKPLLVLRISSAAALLGVVVPMPTDCAGDTTGRHRAANRYSSFITLKVFPIRE